MFNIIEIMGSKFAWSVAYLGLFPAALILGWPPYLWGVLLIGLGGLLFGIVYVQITAPMPRSGADYVIPSRLMGPFWGWINSWMIVWGVTPLWGFVAWVTVRNIKQFIDILRIGGVVDVDASWLLSTPNTLWLGSAIIIGATLMTMLPARRFYRVISVVGIVSILGLFIMGLGIAVASQAAVAHNMKTLMGVSPSDVAATAVKDGFDANGALSFESVAGMAGYIWFAMYGFQSSASISGELRGNVKKSLLVSILGSLLFFMFFSFLFITFTLSQFGYNLVVGWSYLFWNARADAPLGLPPINALLATLAAPNLWPVWLIAGLAAILGVWAVLPVNMVYVSRLELSWGIDRMLPESVSAVDSRFGQPLKLLMIQGTIALLFFYLLILEPEFSPVNLTLWYTLMVMPASVFPAISALLLPRRRPELQKAVPWRKWLVPNSILWLILIIPFYLIAGIIGSVWPITAELSIWEFAFSTGMIATFLTVVIGIAVYQIMRRYNLRHGIDVNTIFQRIPPE